MRGQTLLELAAAHLLVLRVQLQLGLVHLVVHLVDLRLLSKLGLLELDQRIGGTRTGKLARKLLQLLHALRDKLGGHLLDFEHLLLVRSLHASLLTLLQIGHRSLLLRSDSHVLHKVLLQRYRHRRHSTDHRRRAKNHVRRNVSLMVLTLKSFERQHVQGIDVLLRGVNGPWVLFRGRLHNAIDVRDTHGLVHVAVDLVHVVHVRSLRRQLQLGLCQNNALRLAEDVRVTDGNHVNSTVKVGAHDCFVAARYRERIFLWEDLGHQAGQNPELHTHRIMQTLVDRAHDAAALLKHCNRRANRRLLVAVANLQIRDRRVPLTGLNNKTQKLEQRLVRTLERKRHQ